jgi:Spy/CpxP family protein refolding chaperone
VNKTDLLILAATLLAAPAAAQSAPPAQPSAAATAAEPQVRHMQMGRGMMFPSVSPEGRAILRETMRGDPADRQAIRAARDRINGLVGAERLDTVALKREMDAERRLVDSHHAKRQASMLAAIQKLSPADRKAFAADARRGRDRVEMRMRQWREREPGGGAAGESLL